MDNTISASLTELSLASRTGIVINCPVCKRVMWANSCCHHGQVNTKIHPGVPIECEDTVKSSGKYRDKRGRYPSEY